MVRGEVAGMSRSEERERDESGSGTRNRLSHSARIAADRPGKGLEDLKAKLMGEAELDEDVGEMQNDF